MSISTIEPIFKNNFTTIAMSCSSKYVPYLSVCLQSLIEHTDKNHNYDIVILERSITESEKKALIKQITAENISLRFYNPLPILEQFKNLQLPQKAYALECYFRLTSPIVFQNYKKIIFTDIDLIFQEDIKELYNVEINDKPLAACQYLVYTAGLNMPNLDDMKYATCELELKNPYNYFNTGVMLLNLDYWRKNNCSSEVISLGTEKLYRILEQDILNKYFKDNIYYLDYKWNLPVLNNYYKEIFVNAPQEYQDAYKKTLQTSAIIHWAGGEKAWKNLELDFAELWWNYAKKSPFYNIIKERIHYPKTFANEITDSTTIVNLKTPNRFVLLRYKLLAKIHPIKKTRKHYRQKYRMYNAQPDSQAIAHIYHSVFDFSYNHIDKSYTFQDYSSIDTRNISTMRFISLAMLRVKNKLTKSFKIRICTGDFLPSNYKNIWTYAKKNNQNEVKLIPDFLFDNWMSIGCDNFDKWMKILVENSKKEPEYNTCFWSGALDMHSTRVRFYEMAQINSKLECIPVSWKRENWVANKEIESDRKITLLDFPKWKYLIDLPCAGYSGRFKALLFSGRPVFKVDDGFEEFFYKDLKPFVHYIPIKFDLSDLEERLEWAENNYDKALEIAKNAQEYAMNNLTFEKCIQYMEKLILQTGAKND